jgi:arsenate reductase/ArsR family transcriptional regulator
MTKGDPSMRDFELAMKAVGDPTRTRILKLLEGGGLCVCQVQAVLGLAPSTVSKHLTVLKLAGLVEDRRDGKWIEYGLTRDSHNPHAKRVLALLQDDLDRDPAVIADRRRLREIKAIPLTRLCSLPAAKLPTPARPTRHRRTRRERAHG